MASYRAIAVTSLALRGLLDNACPRDRFPGAVIRVAQAGELAKPPFTLGVSIYLHRVTFNTSRRNLPPREAPDGRRYRPSTPVDLHYLIAAWGPTAERQQELLGWTVRTLQDSPVLSAGVLNSFAGSEAPDSAPDDRVFLDQESVELIGEILSYQDLVNVWEVAKANQQPSVPYLARMVLIDSEVELTTAGPVQTRAFDYARPVRRDEPAAAAR